MEPPRREQLVRDLGHGHARIAQVHGWCLAGGTELANACDLIYVAEDAKIGYPPVRLMSPPDMQWQTWTMGMRRGMEALLTGDHMSGLEAVQAGAANRAFAEENLDTEVLAIAERIALIPADLLALNKRAAHRAMEAQGIAPASAPPPTSRHSGSTSPRRSST